LICAARARPAALLAGGVGVVAVGVCVEGLGVLVSGVLVSGVDVD
jgi:hypothetical protein